MKKYAGILDSCLFSISFDVTYVFGTCSFSLILKKKKKKKISGEANCSCNVILALHERAHQIIILLLSYLVSYLVENVQYVFSSVIRWHTSFLDVMLIIGLYIISVCMGGLQRAFS